MDEEWELLTKESEPKTDILQEFVDGMDGSDAKTEKDPHLGKADHRLIHVCPGSAVRPEPLAASTFTFPSGLSSPKELQRTVPAPTC
jgi:hypothetical protein